MSVVSPARITLQVRCSAPQDSSSRYADTYSCSLSSTYHAQYVQSYSYEQELLLLMVRIPLHVGLQFPLVREPYMYLARIPMPTYSMCVWIDLYSAVCAGRND